MKNLRLVIFIIISLIALIGSAYLIGFSIRIEKKPQATILQDTSKTTSLIILEEALSDIGRWIWWTANQEMLHIEFAGVQLYISPTDKEFPPTSILGLEFSELKCVVLMARDTLVLQKNVDWFDKIQMEKSDPFPLSYGSLSLSDPTKALEIFYQAQQMTFLKGSISDVMNLKSEDTFIAFMGGTAGMLIIGNKMTLHSHNGEIELKDIPGLNKKWWDYWKEYWDRKITENPMPYDINCEILTPVKDGKSTTAEPQK